MEKDSTPALGHVLRITDERLQDHLGRSVRGSIEEDPLCVLLDAEAECLIGAGWALRARCGASGHAGRVV